MNRMLRTALAARVVPHRHVIDSIDSAALGTQAD